jgi:Leucine-rich repeat (LRR) protein
MESTVYIKHPTLENHRRKDKKLPYHMNTDLKYKKHRCIDIEELQKLNKDIPELFGEDEDTLKYRIKECNNNDSISLDISHLDLKSIPFNIPINIKYLFCNHNLMKSLDNILFFKKLQILDFSNNKLTKLPELPSTLIELTCRNNYLEDIDLIIHCPNIKRIDFSYNKLNDIKLLKQLENLEVLVINNNNLTDIPDLKNIKKIICKNNKICQLGRYDNMEELECNDNMLTSISNYPNLKRLYCEDNKIEKINTM